MKMALLKELGAGTYLAQGAFGGGVACFLLTLFRIVYPKGVYNFLLILPFLYFVLPSMTVGVVLAALIWLSDAIRNRKSRFLFGYAVSFGTTSLLAIPYSFDSAANLFARRLFLSSLIPAFFAGLLTGTIAVWKLNPLRVVVLGPARRTSLRTRSGWFLSMAGFPLRVGSFLGILLALLLLAYLFTNVHAGWLSFAENDDTRQMLLGTILALSYFAISAFASCTSLRRLTLVGLAALLNAPLAVWAFDQSTKADPNILTVLSWLFIGMWILLIVARAIVLDPKSREADRTSTQSTTGEI